MPKKEENKLAGVCVVNTEALSAIVEHLSTTQVGRVLSANLQSKPIANLKVDEVEHLNLYMKEMSEKLKAKGPKLENIKKKEVE